MHGSTLRKTQIPKNPNFEESFRGDSLPEPLHNDYQRAVWEIPYRTDSTGLESAFTASRLVQFRQNPHIIT